MSFLGIANVARGAIEGIGGAVAGVARVFVGDKAEREAGYHAESMASRAQFATEFQVQNRTWFDSLIDGLNRLPRPAIVAMLIYYFVLAVRDPVEFQIVNIALDGVPDFMWQLALVVVSFYFVAREFQKARDKKMAAKKEDFDERIRQIEALHRQQAEREPQISDDDYATEMTDTARPLSNPAIIEWNRRRKEGWP